MTTNTRGRSTHELQQDAEAKWQIIKDNEDRDIDTVTLKSLSFNSVRPANTAEITYRKCGNLILLSIFKICFLMYQWIN